MAVYLFTNMKDRPVSVMCGAKVAVTKEYSIRRHYEAKKGKVQGPRRKSEASEGGGDEKKSGLPADNVHESEIEK